jgi:Holliday junction DNA helicase RuvA
MIAHLKGRVFALSEDNVVIDVSGVGYRIFCPSPVLSKLSVGQNDVFLLTDYVVREDGVSVFGFDNAQQQTWFHYLSRVQGVGKKIALALLSAFAPEDLQRIVQVQDQRSLTRADGVGPKLAARIVTELKDVVAKGALLVSAAPIGAGVVSAEQQVEQDAVLALEQLGYSRVDAYGLCERAQKENPAAADSTQDLIRAALRQVARV